MHLKKGDTIQMIAGADRGKKGTVLAAFPATGRIAAEGINVKKKHVRPRRQGQKGELVQVPMPFPAPRALLVCRACGKPTRVAFRLDGGKKTRTCKKCGKAA